MFYSRSCLFLAWALLIGVCGWSAKVADGQDANKGTPERPNIVLIMVDDLGYSDLGFHGGEIRTPNLDALAAGGVRFSQFYNSGRCCPTRASLMTGLHPHQTGIGHMTNPANSRTHDRGVAGYRGFINDSCVTIAEVLRGAGYATLMTGKWHLGYDQQECWPLQRGFDKYYGCIEGATRHFHPFQTRGMVSGNERVEPRSTTDEPFYTTDAFTDHAIRFVREHTESDRRNDPFFLYLAYTAPHWPLQAFESDIARYRGKYKQGWDELRKKRYARQIELGLIKESWPLSPRTEGIPDWESLSPEKQDEMDLKMAIFAAMVDRVDQRVGSLVEELKSRGLFENTLIVFLSDNGACQEGGVLGRGEFQDIEKRNLETDNSYGEAWANASSTPFRLYKHFVHEGGAGTPFFMHWPKRIKPQSGWYDSPAQLIDILPTFADLAGAKYPEVSRGNAIPPLTGVTLRPALDWQPLSRSLPLFFEHENNAAVRDGKWKLVGRGVAAQEGVQFDKWELYDIEKDRTELQNLAAIHPEKTRELANQWDAWAARAQVYPKGSADREGSDQQDPNTPRISGKRIKVTAVAQGPKLQGVAISQGGLRFGYSLHFVEGRPAFSVRNNGALTELIAPEAVKGEVKVVATLTEKELLLEVNGSVVAKAPSPGLLKNQPVIGLYRGLDFRDPVGNYRSPNRLNGRLISANVEILKDPQAQISSSKNRPNMVVFLSDDHTWRDSSVYGSPDIQTPNMARLAAAGMTFDNAYVASPSCAPSRAALLTGMWPARNGAEANHAKPEESLRKLPAYLHELGYEVVSFGKVGHYKQTPDYGFDIARHYNYHEDIAVPKALEWLQERDSQQPLCLFVGTNWPHVPWPGEDVHSDIRPDAQVVPPNHVDNEVTRARRARYVAAIRNMDDELGAVYDLVRKKLGEDTFFLHTSDHGAQWPFGKWTLYDDGIRTPLIVSWPGKIKAGVRTQGMVSWIDILPTLIDVAGGEKPEGIDGRSFLPVLTGKTQAHRDAIFATHSGDGNNNVYPMRGVTTPDGWKYIRNLHPEYLFTTHITTKPGDTGYWPSWVQEAETKPAASTLIKRYQQRPGEELYFVKDDPFEQRNLVDDPKHAERLNDLRKRLDEWMTANNDSQTVFGEPKLIAP